MMGIPHNRCGLQSFFINPQLLIIGLIDSSSLFSKEGGILPPGRGIMAKEFFKRLAVPIIIALLTAFFCQPLYLATDGSCDYVLMWILIGIPFGIQKMFIWLVPSKCSIANATGIIVINILIGSMIGIFVFAFRIASGMLYMIAAIVKTVFRRDYIPYSSMYRFLQKISVVTIATQQVQIPSNIPAPIVPHIS